MKAGVLGLAIGTSMVAHAAVAALIPLLPSKPYQSTLKARPVELRMVHITPPRPPVVTPPVAPPPEPVKLPPKAPPRAPPEVAPPPREKPVEPVPPSAVPEPVVQEPVKENPPTAQEPTPPPLPPVATSPGGTLGIPRRTGPGTPGATGTGTGTPNLMLGTAGAARIALNQGGAIPVEAPPDPARPSMLQKAEWKFGGFFNRVQDLVRARYKPLDAFKRRAREDNIAGIISGRSIMSITVDRAGAIKDVAVQESGPAAFLDEEAIRAIQSIGSFVNPPAGLFGDKATYSFLFTFALTVIPPDKVDRFMRGNNNVLEALKNTFTKDGRENIWCEDRVPSCGKACSDGQPGIHVRFVPCRAQPQGG